MKTITIDELERLAPDSCSIVDIRPAADFARGSFPGAINIPMEELELRMGELEQTKPIYLLCHTGTKSVDYVEMLELAGYQAGNIFGGYRSYLRKTLSSEYHAEEERKLRTKEIERSIIKRYRKQLWSPFVKALQTYEMIQPGDKIAVCISGGKDSMLLAKLMQEVQRHGNIPFELVFLVMNPGYNEDNWSIIQNNARILGIPITVFESDIFNVVAEVDKNPCYLCARMRRGYLYSHAKELGCNKIALGHHFDDVIETILMGMLYSGKVETMMPKLHSTNFEGMELIRPLYLIREDDIKKWRDSNDLHFIQCACKFTDTCSTCGGENISKRVEVKNLIRQLKETNPFVESNIFKSVENVNLSTVIAYKQGGVKHHFLDDYDKVEKKEEA